LFSDKRKTLRGIGTKGSQDVKRKHRNFPQLKKRGGVGKRSLENNKRYIGKIE